MHGVSAAGCTRRPRISGEQPRRPLASANTNLQPPQHRAGNRFGLLLGPAATRSGSHGHRGRDGDGATLAVPRPAASTGTGNDRLTRARVISSPWRGSRRERQGRSGPPPTARRASRSREPPARRSIRPGRRSGSAMPPAVPRAAPCLRAPRRAPDLARPCATKLKFRHRRPRCCCRCRRSAVAPAAIAAAAAGRRRRPPPHRRPCCCCRPAAGRPPPAAAAAAPPPLLLPPHGRPPTPPIDSRVLFDHATLRRSVNSTEVAFAVHRLLGLSIVAAARWFGPRASPRRTLRPHSAGACRGAAACAPRE
jgi:hypothetical protein